MLIILNYYLKKTPFIVKVFTPRTLFFLYSIFQDIKQKNIERKIRLTKKKTKLKTNLTYRN